MEFKKLSCEEFTDILSTNKPVPGGGGASALVCAVGTALGSMVGNLTAGKKKYAEYEEDIQRILKKAEDLRKYVLTLIDEDAKVFEPLSKAYGIPKDDPKRSGIMENALKNACKVPLDIMKACCEAIELHSELAIKGSVLALSDVGVGAACCKAALNGASLNVFINTKSMMDREYAEKVNAEADELISVYGKMADEAYDAVIKKLR